MHGGEGDRALGPDRQGPLGVTDAAPVKGEIDDELEGGRAVERPGRATDGDGAEHSDFDAVTGHGEERSAARCVGAEGFEPSLGTV